MVKADVKHNYYADLELPNTCSIDDIKKQYRKLALQYHPDRNAGKEEEYVPKFQAIQTAHEILGDATQKQKYDADRRKACLYPQGATSRGNQSTTGNPYTASSAFPPPPRRTQPGTWQRAQPAGASASGADRFAQFPRGAAPTARKDGTGTQERANMFRAWQNMNTQAQQDRQRPTNTQPPQTPNRRRPAPPPRPESRMPTEEEIRAGMNYRKAPPPPPPQAADSDRAETRQSAWQAFHESGPTTPGLNRSKTTKSARKQGFDPNMPGSDERPASHGYYSTRHKSADYGVPGATSQATHDEASFPPPPPGPPPRSPLSPISPTNQRPMGDPLKPFRSRVMDDEVPYAEANRVSTPYTQASGEKTAISSDGLRRSASVRDTSRLNEQSAAAAAAARARSNSPLRRQANNSTNKNNPPQKPFVQYNSSEESVVSDDSDSAQSPYTGPSAAAASRPIKNPTARKQRRNGATSADPPTTGDGANSEDVSGMQQKSGNNIFNFPINDSTFVSNKSRSEESINTNFSPDGFNGKFEAMPDYFPQQPSRRTSASPLLRSRTAGLRTGAGKVPLSNGQTMPPPPSRPPGLDEEEEVGSKDDPVKFQPEQWQKTFAESSWAWQPPVPGGVSSPSKTGPGSRSSSRKATKTTSKPVSAGTQAEPYIPNDDGSYAVPKSEPVPADYGDAMDIDTPPPTTPAQQQASSTSAPTEDGKGPRQYPVAPSSWHQQQQKAAAQQRQASETTANLSANLDDLAHVEPLARNNGSGLHGLDDLGSNLPFKSQAAVSLSEHIGTPQQLRLPPVPKAPEPPIKLTKQNWHVYSQAFGAYLQAYHAFNDTMLRHFATREGRLQKTLNGGFAWLEATGDTTDDVGFGSYMRGVREDEHVREVWNLGHERHTDAAGGFEKVRERVRKMAIAGTLLEH